MDLVPPPGPPDRPGRRGPHHHRARPALQPRQRLILRPWPLPDRSGHRRRLHRQRHVLVPAPRPGPRGQHHGPDDLTLRKTGLGGAVEAVRFTQAVGVFDHATVEGSATSAWHSDPVGQMNHTDWEKYDNPSGAVDNDGVITISGTGDIGPHNDEG